MIDILDGRMPSRRKGSGTSLTLDLRANNIAVIGINPEGGKPTRVAKISAQFEAGSVFFPKNAPWLSSLMTELLGFPNVKHDDQVDSVSQALSWMKRRLQNRISFVPPIVVSTRRAADYSAAVRISSRSARTAQNLNSGIFPNGSSAGLVNRFAAASA